MELRANDFPIQHDQRDTRPHPPRIPWSVAERAYAVYNQRYPGQSLERLAERGGFGSLEMDQFHPAWRDEVSEIRALRSRLALVEQENAELRKHLDGVLDDFPHWIDCPSTNVFEPGECNCSVGEWRARALGSPGAAT